MRSPGAVVGDVDALLATGAGGDECAVGVEDGLLEEGRWGCCRQTFSRVALKIACKRGKRAASSKRAAEIAGRGGVGDPAGAQGVEVDAFVAPQLQVFETGFVAKGVVGDVQDVVGLVVRGSDLEQAEVRRWPRPGRACRRAGGWPRCPRS